MILSKKRMWTSEGGLRGVPRFPILLAASLTLLWTTSGFAKDFSFKVKHDHVKGTCSGDLIIHEAGIRYQTLHAKDQRQWAYTDIQEVQLISDNRLNVLTYEDARNRLGGDRLFKFELQGEKLSSEAVDFLTARFAKPISNRLTVPNLMSPSDIPVKHLHRVGGCQGKLVFTENEIAFVSDRPGESRQWRYSNLQSIASTGRYELRLGTYEHGPLQYGDTKEFRFRLKEPLRDEVYRAAWAKINQIPVWRPEGNGK